MTKLQTMAGAALQACLWLALAPQPTFGQVPVKSKPGALTSLEGLSAAVQEITAAVAPSVVQIRVTSYGPERSDGYGTNATVIGRQQAIGSGLIVHPDGYIVTNAHVVEGAQRIRVTMLDRPQAEDGASDSVLTRTLAQATAEPKEATVVGVLEEFDIALIKISGKDLPVLEFADYRNLRQGQLVFAFGSRGGLDHSVSMGVVSSIARQPEPDSPFLFIQTDAAINPGDSGGPLVNTAGEVVGINTFILSNSGGSEGLGFAIPSALIEYAATQLRQYGHLHRPVIGIGVQALTPILAEALRIPRSSGVIISDITAKGPADMAGLKLNDLVLAIDGRPIHNVPMFAMTMLQSPTDQPLKLEILREGRAMSVSVTPREADGLHAETISDLVDPAHGQIPRLGIVAVEVDKRVAKLLPELRNASGVYVAGRLDADEGSASGLRVGDVIHEINGSIVLSVQSLEQKLEAFQRGDAVALLVERHGSFLYEAFEAE
ncbi:MAG: PDZ domain-containing protein [Acidobacteria bacterium]|nr:PDZ domain-containing protein [Acidobacteriota bacterium]